MTELLAHLKEMISLPGLSGYEEPVRQVIEAAWRPLVDELSVSPLGSLHALRRGTGPQPRPSLLLAAHMDAIGLMVKGLVDGFLRLTRIGGLDPRLLPGQLVTVYGRKELAGIIVLPPASLLPPDHQDGVIPLEYLLVDTGLTGRELERLVRVGDLVAFAQPPLELSDDLLVGHSLDNRVSVAVVSECLQALKGRSLAWDVWAVATTQEEVTLGGARTSAFALRPTLGVAIDATFGTSPGSSGPETFPLGGGVTLGWGPNIHPGLYRVFKALAEHLEIPFRMEPMPRSSGTDAMGMQIAAEGVPTFVLSVPIRYMHSPVEMVALKDIRRAARLLAEFAAGLEPDFIQTLAWDEEEKKEARP